MMGIYGNPQTVYYYYDSNANKIAFYTDPSGSGASFICAIP